MLCSTLTIALHTVRSQQQGHLSNGTSRTGLQPAKSTRDLSQYSAFMKRSKLVGRNISSTYAKLEKLTLRMYFMGMGPGGYNDTMHYPSVHNDLYVLMHMDMGTVSSLNCLLRFG